MNNFPFVSIIIINYNGEKFLKECFDSLERLDYPNNKFEVILVDNNSEDGSFEYTIKNFPWIRILQLDKNYGFCKPNNEGAKIAKGKYIVLLNNDTVVTKNWLSELVKGALSNNKIISCASKMLYYDRKDTINTSGGKITIVGGGFYRGYGDKDGEMYNKFEYTGFGCGAGVLVDREFFINIGGFDEDYFASCEEHELGLRCWMNGYKVLYVPTAVMYHKESATFGNRSRYQPLKVYLITRNRLFMILKNLEAHNVIKGFFITFLFDTHRSLKYIINRNFDSFNAILRAYYAFISNINKTLRKRKIVQTNRKLSDKDLYSLGVIATLRECINEELRLCKLEKDENLKEGKL